jgi:catechol 2,3-dioxygenase-like lactoylglutathione lyase family enzyme
MKLYGVRIWVNDIEAARRFYGETLGLKTDWDYGAVVGFEIGEAEGPQFIVELDDGSHDEESLVGRFVGVSLSVDDIEATFLDLTGKGVEFLGPPDKQPWGGTLAHFKDPSGNTLTLLG